VDVEPLTLTELIARTTHRWRTLVAGLLIGVAIGVAGHLAMPTRYEAVAVLRVDAADPSVVDMTAEAAVATSRRVTAEALDAMGDRRLTIRELEDAATASAVPDSRLLRVGYVADAPQGATRGADALAQAYLAVRAVEPGPGPTVTGVVVDPARKPTSPVGPGAGATALAGGVLGLLVAAPAAARPTRSRAARAS
jgi:uncharacterized protein involved in exopolysaccharide biosynthesis